MPKSNALRWWTRAGGAGPKTRSSRSSWRTYRRRAKSRQQRRGMAFRAHYCCDGDGRFSLSRRMPPKRICGNAALRFYTEPEISASIPAATTAQTSIRRPRLAGDDSRGHGSFRRHHRRASHLACAGRLRQPRAHVILCAAMSKYSPGQQALWSVRAVQAGPSRNARADLSDAIDTARSARRHSCGGVELPTAGAKLEIFAACSEKRLCARQWFRKRRRGTAP